MMSQLTYSFVHTNGFVIFCCVLFLIKGFKSMKVEDQAEMKKVIGFKKASKNGKKKTKEEKKPVAEVTEDAKLKVNIKAY